MGRRQGDSRSGEAILDAALQLFSEHGYDATSMRAVAARAGVDPALVRYFFTDKETLFASTVTKRSVVPERLIEAFAGDPAQVGYRVTDTYLKLWVAEDTRPLLMTLLRAAVTTPRAAEMFFETLGVHVGEKIGDAQGAGFSLAASHLLGIVMTRHILEVPAIVQMPHEELVKNVAPTVQNYLTKQDF